jgi:hypothetical protein
MRPGRINQRVVNKKKVSGLSFIAHDFHNPLTFQYI